ncbi:MAG: ferredoxin--NADP reductase [Myxococcales bacterium]|nr:ferredoxin--NADP reductase [Myxococcales bacterium]MCB9531737.1 ferredoxin--NADP reductase [Myxococcales bacterium]MCB9534096.1 ferredoxin--NADP reductase [Myxococcales bacterium]
MARTELDLELASIERITPTVLRFGFAVEPGAFEFVPGQFLMIHFELDGEAVQRSYSIASRADVGERLAIAVAPVDGGRATRYLWARGVGDVVRVSGPYGRFTLRNEESPRRLALVGTGTGIAPYRAMLPAVAARAAAGLQTTILLGARTRSELLFADEFRAASGPHVDFVGCVSREAPGAPDERAGYVTAALEELALDPDHDLAYVCGNPQMVDDAMELLKARGFTPRNIRREKYI